MWWLLLLLVGYVVWVKRREGMSPSASELNWVHAGEIQKLTEQLSAYTLTQSRVTEVETCVNTNTDNALEVQQNMKQANPNENKNAYPTEPA